MRGRDKEFLNTVREFRTERQRLVGYDGQPVTAHKEVCQWQTIEVVPRYFAPSSAHVAEGGFCITEKGEQYDNC